MDHRSIDRQTRHVADVLRTEAWLESLNEEEVDAYVEERRSNASLRWQQCDRSFRSLFMAMSRGSHSPIDTFEVCVKQEMIKGQKVETYVRIWRDRRDGTFNVKPFIRNGRIEDHSFVTESFGDMYVYNYGTQLSKIAKLRMSHDGPEAELRLDRMQGYKVNEMSHAHKAVFISAVDAHVAPSLDRTEETLTLIYEAALDFQLNPGLADKLRI